MWRTLVNPFAHRTKDDGRNAEELDLLLDVFEMSKKQVTFRDVNRMIDEAVSEELLTWLRGREILSWLRYLCC